jgi:hypothetical protein
MYTVFMQFKVHFRLWYVEGLIIKLCCMKKIVPKLETAEIFIVFIADSGLYPLHLHATARYAAMHPYMATQSYHRNFCDIEHGEHDQRGCISGTAA